MDLAQSDRMGPVHVDFPMDLQRKLAGPQNDLEIAHREFGALSSEHLSTLVSDLKNATAPLLYFGNGVRKPESIALAHSLVSKLKIPYLVSWSAIDLFPENDPLNVGRVGIYGDRHANLLLQKSDLIVAIGTRLAIPQLGYDKNDFGRKAKKWVIEIDATECAKFAGLGWSILNNDAESVMLDLLDQILQKLEIANWLKSCESLKAAFPRVEQLGPEPANPKNQIHSGEVIEYLNSALNKDAVIVTDVGAALLNGHYLYKQCDSRRFFTSQGLGEMGFGLPAAIGAHFAEPGKQIVCLNTDGAIMFNLQELQVIAEHRIPMKLFIFNNAGYSMIRISQENLFERRLAGSTIENGISFPSFKSVAETFGLRHVLVDNSSLLPSIDDALASEDAVLFEIIMDPEQKYYPRLATNKLPDGTLVSPPIEDLDPKIDIDLLEEMLGYPPHENSYKARGLR
jgi:acetolactate synthase-1/2/3 large subunit